MISKQLEFVRNITDFEPEIAIVLGSGLGNLANKCETVAEIPYCDIPYMPVSTAPSHEGKLIFGYLGNKKAVLLQGRLHLYEGYSAEEAVRPIRLVKALGAKNIILTNASGGINKAFHAGDFMLICDHISCFVPSPLTGKNDDTVGPRFPDMSKAYNPSLQNAVRAAAYENGIPLRQGVYVQLTGPQFETPAEIKMLSALGADAVGMSTVIETIAAVHCGMNVCGISLITNLACGLLDRPLSGEEVTDAANVAAAKFETLITQTISKIG